MTATPTPLYAEGGNPFMGQPKKINVAQFLAEGAVFGPFTSRNLTRDPKENDEPAGLSLDHDKNHPQISPLLQVMPQPLS